MERTKDNKSIEIYNLYNTGLKGNKDKSILMAIEEAKIVATGIINHYYPDISQNNREEIQQEIILEVMRILPRYNIDKGASFKTFANLYIKHKIIEWVNINLNHDTTWNLKKYGKINMNYINDDRNQDYQNLLTTKESPELFILEQEDRELRKDILYRYIERLKDRQKQILILSYGLYNKNPMKTGEIAKLLGLKPRTVTAIKRTAVENLQKLMTA